MCILDESQFRSFLVSRFPCKLVSIYQLKIYVNRIEVQFLKSTPIPTITQLTLTALILKNTLYIGSNVRY